MPLTTPALPVLILLLGATLILLTKRFLRDWGRDGLAISVAAAFLLSLPFVYRDRPTTITMPLSSLAPGLGLQLGLYIDNLSLLFASLIGLMLLLVVLAQSALPSSDADSAYSYGGIFLLGAAAISFVLAADVMTLYLSWGFLDLALLAVTAFLHRGRAASRTGLRLLAVNYLAGLALLASLVLLQWQGVSFSLQAMLLPSKVLSLMLFAALVRLGLYPALVALPADVDMRFSTVVAWYAIPFSAAGYLLARVVSLASAAPVLGREAALLFGTLALILAPFPLWFEGSMRKAASYIVLNQVGYLALASATPGPSSTVIVSAQVLSTTLALSLLLLASVSWSDQISQRYALWIRCCAFVGVAALAGTPLTMGFVIRWLLYDSMWQTGLGPLIVLSLTANSFLLAPLLKMFLQRAPKTMEQASPSPLLVGEITALAIPLVLLGLHPPLIGLLLGAQNTTSPLPSLPELIYSIPPPLTAALMTGILASLGLGYLMFHKGRTIVSRAGTALETLKIAAEMDWLYRALGWTVPRFALTLERLSSFFEERHSSAWILLFSVLVALLLLST
jgi:NADH-quinone oxidoreductase subunit L